MATSSFFYGGSSAPEQNTVDELIDTLNAKVAEAEEDRVAAEQAAASAAQSAAGIGNSLSVASAAAAQAVSSANTAQAAAADTINFKTILTVESTGLASGASPTVAYDADAIKMTFGIPAGTSGAEGPQGIQGPAGDTGPQGPTGQGVPTGGTTGQALVKVSGTNYDTQWATISGGGGGGSGDVVGPASSTDNAIARFDGTTGKLVQNSTSSLSDTGDATFKSVVFSDPVHGTRTLAMSSGRLIVDGDFDTAGTYRFGNGWGFLTGSNADGVTLGQLSNGTGTFVLQPNSTGIVEARNGTNPINFRVYNTYTDGSNYERLSLAQTSNEWRIDSQAAGTGSVRAVAIYQGGTQVMQFGSATMYASTHLRFGTDNTHDIGDSGVYRPRTGYFGTSLVVNGSTVSSTTIGNWNTAFGWGNHASAGYLTTSTAASTYAPISTTATLTGTQTLTNKTLTSPVVNTPAITGGTASGLTLNDGYTEEVFAVTGTTPALSPNNGSIQTWTLTANSTPTQGTWAAGQSITLMVNDTASAFTVNWTSLPVTWVGGSAPTLAPGGGFTVIVLWEVGTTIYGALTGQVA